MNWYEAVFEVIDMRSFSNLWYWIGLAIFWSSVSHWVLGVPYDSIMRARRGTPPEAMKDLHDLVRVNVNRILYIAEISGVWIALFGSALLAAFFYGIEFAQAVFLLVAPLTLIGFLSIRTARRIRDGSLQGEELIKRLLRHRFVIQLVGVVAICGTAMYGMFVNLYVGPFGGY